MLVDLGGKCEAGKGREICFFSKVSMTIVFITSKTHSKRCPCYGEVKREGGRRRRRRRRTVTSEGGSTTGELDSQSIVACYYLFAPCRSQTNNAHTGSLARSECGSIVKGQPSLGIRVPHQKLSISCLSGYLASHSCSTALLFGPAPARYLLRVVSPPESPNSNPLLLPSQRFSYDV